LAALVTVSMGVMVRTPRVITSLIWVMSTPEWAIPK
jgi:hypothetical protein